MKKEKSNEKNSKIFFKESFIYPLKDKIENN
jgi:hypothetical protein